MWLRATVKQANKVCESLGVAWHPDWMRTSFPKRSQSAAEQHVRLRESDRGVSCLSPPPLGQLNLNLGLAGSPQCNFFDPSAQCLQ